MMQHPLLDANRVANSDATIKRFMVVFPWYRIAPA
jgi:hypothetical protein